MGCLNSKESGVSGAGKVQSSDPIWGRYDRIRILGQGASANVWLARPKKNIENAPPPGLVALKMIHKRNPQCRVIFDHEMSILKLLAHPNILAVVDSFETETDYVLATQYLSGGEMFERLQKLHHYTEKTAATMAKKMLQALYYCHKHNVVHRDLKPENYVYVDQSVTSELKLIDFGESLNIQDDQVHEDGVGTPYYIAPEIIDNEFKFPRTGKVLKGADVWSLGVIFFMMLSGHPPFDGEDENEIYDSVMIGEYTWNPMIRVSDQAKDLVSKMLTVDHTKRITAAEALNHPWIANHESNSDVSLNDALKALKDFSTASLIKKAVANILIKEMTEEDTAKLKQLFDELDTDGDRALDLDELTLYMKHHGHAEDADAEAAAKAFLEAADESKRGTINFLEFESAHMRGQLGKDAVAIRKAFDAIDADKSGSIGHEKVKALLGEENAKAFAELFSHSGVALERTITFQDFFKAMTSEGLKEKMGRSQALLRGFMSASRRSLFTQASTSSIQSISRVKRVNSFGPAPPNLGASSKYVLTVIDGSDELGDDIGDDIGEEVKPDGKRVEFQ